MTINEHLDYLDKYLRVDTLSSAGRAVVDSFEGSPGNYEGMDYNSDEFRLEIVRLFGKTIGMEIMALQGEPEYRNLVDSDSFINTTLNEVHTHTVTRIASVAQKISKEDWQKGERKNLRKNLEVLQGNYHTARRLIDLALGED